MHSAAFLQPALQLLQAAFQSLPTAWQAAARESSALALTALWQGAAVALGLGFCLRIAPRGTASQRFALWAAAFGALVGLQLLPLLARLAPPPAAIPAAGPAIAASAPWQLDVRWSLLIAALWLAASLYRAADLALHTLRLRRLWKSATPVPIGSDRFAALTAALHRPGRRPAQICTTERIERPGVIGFLLPRILVPAWLFERLTPGELEQIVLHETEHLRRADDWTNLLQKLCLVLFPLNPALAWIERRLCREREMACDDGVVRVTRAPRAYAACLTSLAERGLARNLARRADALSLGAWQRRPELAHRVHSVLRRNRTLHPLAARVALGAAATALVFGSIELARCPQLFAFVQPAAHDPLQAPARLEARITPLPPPAAFAPTPPARSARPHSALPAHPFRHLPAPHAVEAVAASKPVPQPIDRALRTSATAPAPQELAQLSGPAAESHLEHSAHAELLMQHVTGDPALPVTEQSWMVLTTWEQVPASPYSAVKQTTADAVPGNTGSGNGTDRDGGPGASNSSSATRRILVTRLFLRVDPRTFHGKLPANAVLRGNWLVIQL